jgi:phage baseplate assembly protein W
MDLPLYKIDLNIARSGGEDTMTDSMLTSNSATGVEVLAGKVIKYLMTIQGTDAINPEYGCNIMTYTQIAKNDLAKFQLELISALSSCATSIKASESDVTDSSTKLDSIQLVKMVYNQGVIRDQVDIYIKITSMTGEDALLEIPVG